MKYILRIEYNWMCVYVRLCVACACVFASVCDSVHVSACACACTRVCVRACLCV